MELSKRPQNPIIVNGFPGFGLVGSIATEFLVSHCKCELIGKHYFEKLPATIAVHDGKVINPVSIYYNSDRNVVIVHGISGGQGIEWEIADLIVNLAKELNASQVISLEGVGSAESKGSKVFYIAQNPEQAAQFKTNGAEELKEGIIVGVTSALVMKSPVPIAALFAETHSELPDSKASAHLLEVLDKYLKLDIDTKPLLEQAQKFEQKLNKILKQGMDTQEEVKKKQLNYVG
jgi:uncharacterized protein